MISLILFNTLLQYLTICDVQYTLIILFIISKVDRVSVEYGKNKIFIRFEILVVQDKSYVMLFLDFLVCKLKIGRD